MTTDELKKQLDDLHQQVVQATCRGDMLGQPAMLPARDVADWISRVDRLLMEAAA